MTAGATTGPLTQRWYERTTEPEMMRGQYVTVREMRNGNGSIAAGTPVKISRKFGGLTIRAERCDCCGYAPTMSRVSPSDLAEVEQP